MSVYENKFVQMVKYFLKNENILYKLEISNLKLISLVKKFKSLQFHVPKN